MMASSDLLYCCSGEDCIQNKIADMCECQATSSDEGISLYVSRRIG